MSSTLKWKPEIEHGESLSDELKYRLREIYDLTYIFELRLSFKDLNTIKALSACGTKGADDLLKILEEHEVIVLSESY